MFPTAKKNSYTYFDLFRFKSTRKITLVSVTIKLGLNYLFFGIIFSLSAIGNNFALNMVFLGIGDIIGYLFSCKYKFIKINKYIFN